MNNKKCFNTAIDQQNKILLKWIRSKKSTDDFMDLNYFDETNDHVPDERKCIPIRYGPKQQSQSNDFMELPGPFDYPPFGKKSYKSKKQKFSQPYSFENEPTKNYYFCYDLKNKHIMNIPEDKVISITILNDTFTDAEVNQIRQIKIW